MQSNSSLNILHRLQKRRISARSDMIADPDEQAKKLINKIRESGSKGEVDAVVQLILGSIPLLTRFAIGGSQTAEKYVECLTMITLARAIDGTKIPIYTKPAIQALEAIAMQTNSPRCHLRLALQASTRLLPTPFDPKRALFHCQQAAKSNSIRGCEAAFGLAHFYLDLTQEREYLEHCLSFCKDFIRTMQAKPTIRQEVIVAIKNAIESELQL